ncbi:hypothetical protein TCAL_14930 [Tigriopus californicus]|uniref:Uncharacterized protein n=1 Tax=Tigriopus californicus TaxID=6832 RepID=A0A553N993_TIGCA|nr:hypothetical protein TCAL_14930 [Tigriopus californicus]
MCFLIQINTYITEIAWTEDIEGVHHPNSQTFSGQFLPPQGHEVRRSVYINSSVEPHQCDCEHVVLVLLSLSQLEADAFCPHCQCNFQIRNLGMNHHDPLDLHGLSLESEIAGGGLPGSSHGP